MTAQGHDRLTKALSASAQGSGLILHVGECAERIASTSLEEVDNKHQVISALGEHVAMVTNVVPLLIGRIGGQFAKSRSAPTETLKGETYPSYLGDLFNDPEWSLTARQIVPERIQAGHQAAMLIQGHLADLQPKVFTSHELLVPSFEELFDRPGDYQSSADLLWIGYRSKTGWPWHFAGQIKNPMGIKLGFDHQPEDISQMSARLRSGAPDRPIVWIFRLGKEQWTAHGRALARAVGQLTGTNLVLIDPMHGNTLRSGDDKVRQMDDILTEVRAASLTLSLEGLEHHGLHLELHYGQHNEVVDGECPRQRPICDPQLNLHQAKRVITEYLNSR